MKYFAYLTSVALIFSFGGCGSSSNNSDTTTASTTSVGVFLDKEVQGLEYQSNSYSGKTDAKGRFKYKLNEEVTFKVGNTTLGKKKMDRSYSVVTPLDLVGTTDTNDTKVVNILQVLQTLDADKNVSNGISITTRPANDIIDLSVENKALDTTEIAKITSKTENDVVSKEAAQEHFKKSLQEKDSYQKELQNNHGETTNHDGNDENNGDNEDNGDGDNNGDGETTGGGTTGGGGTTTGGGTAGGSNTSYTLLAWNDLGMHCMDGSDFSVFTILPPYNNLDAQLITKAGTSNKHINSGVVITYESYEYNNSINTISSTKTNFWTYLTALFPGTASTPDVGLTGNKTPSTVPQKLQFNATNNWFEATGLPLINRDDNNQTNYYPMVKVTAKDTTGAVLASANIVLPVSDEMDCAKCHASTVTSTDAKPIAGWENNPNKLKDFKFNILRLHDQNHIISQADLNTLKSRGYDYNASLYDTAKSGTPILCAACHSSNALGTTSVGNAPALTTALHSKHAGVIDPANGMRLNDSANRTACYSCHPGSTTQCLRGAMGSAKDATGNQEMQCQSCHGTLSDVGSASRTGWLDEPNCQACHQNGNRYTSALQNGTLRNAVDTRFATNPNTPQAGVSMYRYSTGHGKLQCSACHGSTHAIFPTSHLADNLQSISVQGHSGTIAECTSCHATMPSTTTGGPHGMHTVGQDWVSAHKHVAENNSAQCKACHGSDYRGSALSKTFSARTLTIEHGTKSFAKGHAVSCYDCHNGPNP
jgi:hypothetical protein